MSLNLIFSVTYDDIFKNERTRPIAELLNGIPSKSALMIIADAAAQVHMAERDSMRQIKLLVKWTGTIPLVYQSRLQQFVDRLSKIAGAKFNFINNTSLLILTQHVLVNWNDLEMVDKFTSDQELSLFKAYLRCSEEWVKKQTRVKQSFSSTDGLLKTVVPLKFPYDEILVNKDFRLQLLKAAFFFRFCEGHPVFGHYVQVFLKEHNVSSWHDYISNVLSTYMRKFDELQVSSVLMVGDEHKPIQEFLRQFAIDPHAFTPNDDFTQIREKPIVEIRENEFLFINLSFFLDKFFQGIQFSLFKALKRNKVEYNGKKIEKFDHYKSIYGEEMSEKGLFYSIFGYTFNKLGIVKFSGEEMKSVLRGSEPDYYVRQNGKILLLEYKDVLINAEIKHSYNYEKITEEIFKKLVSNQDSSAKGVTQLVNTIERVLNGGFSGVDTFDSNHVAIYPILIVTEFVLTLPGVNYLLNKEFRKRLAGKGIDNAKIRDLVLIDLNTVLRFHQEILQGKLELAEYIDRFNQFRKRPGDVATPLLTFEGFINDNYKLRPDYKPDILMREIRGMIRD